MLNLCHPSAFGQQNVLLFIQYTNYKGATGCSFVFFLTAFMLLESVKFFQASEAQKYRKLFTPLSGVWVQLE